VSEGSLNQALVSSGSALVLSMLVVFISAGKVLFEVTYNVSSGTLVYTIEYHYVNCSNEYVKLCTPAPVLVVYSVELRRAKTSALYPLRGIWLT